jgi:NodT family efflux transporter outer membrane factor (OMF) lipoprotein
MPLARSFSSDYMTVLYGQIKLFESIVTQLTQLNASPKSLENAGRAALLAAALLLPACASLPDRTPAAQSLAPESFAATQSLAGPQAAWPSNAWWRGYGDSQLDGLIDEALQHSPSLAQAEARLRAAEAARGAARANAGPNVELNASVEERKQSYNNGIPAAFVQQGYNDYGRATLDFSYAIDFWGRNRAAIAAATSDARAAEAETAQTRLMLSSAIADSYAELARLYAERDIAAQSLDVRTQTVTLVDRRVRGGLDTQGELRQAEAGPPTARADIAALDESIAQTRYRIAALLGAGPDRGLSIARPQIANLSGFGVPTNLSAELIGRRPDIVAARWRAEAASQRVGQAQASFYPNVNLVAFVGLESLGLDAFARSGSDIGGIGPALNLPIFDSGRLQSNLRRADAERDAAVASYNETLTEALRDVAEIVASSNALQTRIDETRTALGANEDAYRIARLRYDGGLSNYQSVLISEDRLLTQRRALAALESRRFTLNIALARALGGGFTTVAANQTPNSTEDQSHG